MAQPSDQRISHWLHDEFQSGRLLPGLTSGVLMGISEVILALSLGSLIFSGDLAAYLPYGIGLALATAAIMLIVTSLSSLIPGVIGSMQDSSSVIVAVMVAGLAGALSTVSAGDRLTTVLVAIGATTLLTGFFLLALGYFKLGGLVRFVPYPVVGGFVAGTGWLLMQGSFGVMAGFPLTLPNIPALLQPERLVLWVPAVLFALLLFYGLRHIRHFLVMPGMLVGAIVVVYLTLLITNTPLDEAVNMGLLLGSASGGPAWQPLVLDNLSAANWAAILGQSGNIAIVLILSLVGLLLNASALELAIRQDVDLNRELRAAGIANLLSGLGGGTVGYPALSLSTLSYRIGARGRLPGLLAGVLCGVMLFVGPSLLAFFPKPILGGLLFFLGLDFLADWVIVGWSKLSRADYAVVLLILIVIGATNFLIGIGVGLVAATVLFVLSYSRINVVYHALTGAEMRSSVEHCAYHRRRLTELGRHVYILELQGFIFFGTANSLLERIRSRAEDRQQPMLRYVVLDFRRVSGLDSSAMLSFAKVSQLTKAQEVTLVLTHLSDEMQHQFAVGGLSADHADVRIFPDLDHGLEWCEGQLLGIDRVTMILTPVTLGAQLVDSGFAKANIARLMAFLERLTVAKGDYLIRQGDEADNLYFIEMGTVSVCLEMVNGKQVRLQTFGLGTAVGELDLYRGTTCTSSVIADAPTIAYRLTRTALLKMKEQEPALAVAFHEFVAHLLSQRLAATTRTLEAVLK